MVAEMKASESVQKINTWLLSLSNGVSADPTRMISWVKHKRSPYIHSKMCSKNVISTQIDLLTDWKRVMYAYSVIFLATKLFLIKHLKF